MNAIYAITYIEAWKIQDFNGDLNPWPRDAGAKFNIWNTSYVTGSRFRRSTFLMLKVPIRKACRAKYRMLDRIGSKIFLFLLFSNACRSDSKSSTSSITVAGVVTNLASAFIICDSDDSCFWNPFFYSIAFFQLENPFFVNAGSALDEVRIPLWSAFKQVWQRAASLLSSWCNHLNCSNHAVWNDLFVAFLLPKVFEIFRLVWTIWYVYKDLIWRAELGLCRF